MAKHRLFFSIILGILELSQSNTPGHIKAFISRKGFVNSEDKPKLTLAWYPRYTNSKVNVSCVTRINDCKPYCDYYYLNCLNCYSWKDGFKWENYTVAGIGATSATLYDFPLEQILDNNLIVVCSIGLMIYSDYWSAPIIVNTTQNNGSAPRLAVAASDSNGVPHIYLYDTTFIGSSREITLISKQKQNSSQKVIDYNYGKPGSEDPTFTQVNESRFLGENKTGDFCINWVNRKRYEVRNQWVKENINSSRIVEVDEYTKEENTVYDAGENVTIQQVVCQPIAYDDNDNVLAWTQINHTATVEKVSYKKVVVYKEETTIRMSHPIGSMSSQNVLENCSNSDTCSAAIVNSTALGLDMTLNSEGNPTLIFFDSSGDVVSLDWQNCFCEKITRIKLDTSKNSVTSIAADMFYVYILVNGKLEMVPRDEKNMSYDINLNDVQNITDIIAVAPELRSRTTGDLYFPDILDLNVTMVTPSVAEVNITLDWPTQADSMRPPFKVEVRFGKVTSSEDTGCPELGCKHIETGFDFQNDTQLSFLVTALSYETYYWFEVQVTPLDSEYYDATYLGPVAGQNFYSNFTEDTKNYGYTSDMGYLYSADSSSSELTSSAYSGSSNTGQSNACRRHGVKSKEDEILLLMLVLVGFTFS